MDKYLTFLGMCDFGTCWMVLESLGGISLGGTFPNSFQPGALADSFCFLENRPLANTQARNICHTHTHCIFTHIEAKEICEQSNKMQSGVLSSNCQSRKISTKTKLSFGELKGSMWPCKWISRQNKYCMAFPGNVQLCAGFLQKCKC